MLRELFAPHHTNPDRVTADYAVLAEPSRGPSDRDILNVCVNAIYAGTVDADPAKWMVTQGMIEREIAKMKKAKAEHSGGEGRAEEEDRVSVGVIREDWLLWRPGRLGIGRGAETGCEGASLPRGRHQKLKCMSVTVRKKFDISVHG